MRSLLSQRRPSLLQPSVVLLFVAALAYNILRVVPARWLSEFDAWSIGQLFALPFLYWTLARMRIGGERIPRSLLITAVLLTAGGAYLSYRPHGTVAVARLSADEYETDTRIFRERINQLLTPIAAEKLVRYFLPLESQLDAQDFLAKHEELLAVVWGNKKWLFLSFAPDRPLISWTQNAYENLYGITGMRVIENVPLAGISFQEEHATALFLAHMLAALEPRLGSVGSLESADAVRESLLLRAGTIQGRWSAAGHRALSWWLLGNLYLGKAFDDDAIDRGDLHCALHSFAIARKFVRAKENPKLFVALKNNAAVAMTALGVVHERRAGIMARRFLLAARQDSSGIVEYNVAALLQLEQRRQLIAHSRGNKHHRHAANGKSKGNGKRKGRAHSSRHAKKHRQGV